MGGRRVGKLIIVGVVLVAALAVPSAASATVPNARDRYDAKVFARDYWRDRGYETTCYGVRVRLRPFYERSVRDGVLGYVRNGRCTIWLNSLVDWSQLRGGWGHWASWWRTCMVVTHEFGHLPGIERPHSFRPNNIMAAAESLSMDSSWWPFFPGCRYEGDDADDDGVPNK